MSNTSDKSPTSIWVIMGYGILCLLIVFTAIRFVNQPDPVFTVYEKQFLPASSETVTEGFLLSQKTVEYVYPDRWCVMVTYEDGTNIKIRDYYVTCDVYETITVGDTFVYTPARGDMDSPPCVKSKLH